MNIAPQSKKLSTGTVTEALPDTLFRVEFDQSKEDGSKETVLAYLAGKMRMHRIRVLVGDHVELEQDQYGGKARITRRI
ncbi:translation initiation factor IF-1 [Patescibacteria group bacterium]|nr:translation initiation factor IF-1 [Patescibacteria group bacterium]MDE1946497.1 translation initiation factor IF-1 [Patescibacteria group bacterium]MDE2011258.1 translation initiation factor IF-1 [Patescibacteria group bacterium]MDE2233341.1 translation initiation factor IF-1 [Patescibacteria group bacterium]